ncbi:MAG TPA: dihydroneopterin aldolase [Magnetospirillum sp.]|nr:dihydroneopterin aldolase [Magnetospirillum sp.]
MYATNSGPNLYRILVRDLVLKCLIGIHPHELLAPQRVRINVDMAVLEQAGPLSDDIANVVSYEDVIEGIKRMLAEGHINLVETLAEKIATLCLADARVSSVRVRVEKLDVYAEAASVGIEIERRQE